MPSLGNQYFAFGGSLPELSLTSLTRLLPNSSANDSTITSCPSLFTLFHSPLYVYPSQQHLATPFINASGSITFGSFLSSGTSLCSTQRNSPSEDSNHTSASNTDIAGRENKMDESPGVYTRQSPRSASERLPTSSCSSSQPQEVKLPGYSHLAGSLLNGGLNLPVITALPAFSTLTRNMDSRTHGQTITSHAASTHTTHMTPTVSTSQVVASNLNTLACVATAQQQQQRVATEVPGMLPKSSMSTIAHSSSLSPMQSITESKERLLTMNTQPAELFMGGQGQAAAVNGIPPLDLNGVSGITPTTPETKHRGRRDKERPYKCDHPGCGRSFSFPAHLRSHIQQIHISYRPCKCEFPGCGKRFYTPQHLNVHRRVHTGERPFVCPYSDCVKAFTTAGNLKNHIRTHTGERPYACKFEGCTKRFAEMSSLKKHELTHTGEKPYKCRVCGKAFSQAGSRNTHERKHSRTEEEESSEGKLSRRYRIKRVPKQEPPQ